MLRAVAPPHCPSYRSVAAARQAVAVRSTPRQIVFGYHEGSPSLRQLDAVTEKSECMKEGFSDIFIMSSGRGEMTVRRALQKKPPHETETQRHIISSSRGPNIDDVTCVLES